MPHPGQAEHRSATAPPKPSATDQRADLDLLDSSILAQTWHDPNLTDCAAGGKKACCIRHTPRSRSARLSGSSSCGQPDRMASSTAASTIRVTILGSCRWAVALTPWWQPAWRQLAEGQGWTSRPAQAAPPLPAGPAGTACPRSGRRRAYRCPGKATRQQLQACSPGTG